VKPFLFLILCLFFSAAPSVLAIDTIQPADAAKRAGEEVYVGGVVASVHATPKGVAFINLNEAYPHQIFTGFIPNLSAIGDETWLNGKGKPSESMAGSTSITPFPRFGSSRRIRLFLSKQ
jgi:hypothetical protein